ncbi:hypothetical protein FIA58_005055 [Flavobacterium jejuense]|uniref:DUF4149 domain-containing protein n=1 Tax=Flavobacterium jejuense TaxID=1544455 RepID=A0ABX0IN67_9FLAO|nr:hypothetical protein [Flavobacterium jejuense]NHN25041.1 hypothetical protein [Flavobacterium jejuense]
MKTKLKITIATLFIWIGFVCAISFMEAWLKFRAPNITTALGLGIGQLVFAALNKVELFLSSSIIILFLLQLKNSRTINLYFGIAYTILLLQTFWILPELNERATKIIQEIIVPKSQLHFVFVTLEIIKVVCLFLFGKNQFKQL